MLLEVSKLFEDDEEIVEGFQQFLLDKHAQRRMTDFVDKPSDSKSGGRKKGEASATGGASTSRNGVGSSVPQKRKRKTAAEREREERERQKDLASKAGPSKVRKSYIQECRLQTHPQW